ncbi:uncharacterized protein MONOS_9617 [Monocercomonoides exilis]|uniref:uncharacterized protein n=1 Tax=Monocercomonoides exilis TaxID=2049356 RepID=UPI00355A9968|nr:hypothetical protein MONOS_9617 [Monocercomonoides exilis]|eukprot:MONOS_9617.1-p1 / transcript=MONOS_9617.1 / gene=MONOS_9617 / organism=Monocercomonoides_exilis_PA203 / gene_product=unspecified product / transcript_product=unspecified product / location=Mono_scaffold00403:6376-7586(+) / protein_length=294 / sequence_SO=supercontig / SO=protein_coding / is_pseudo=false
MTIDRRETLSSFTIRYNFTNPPVFDSWPSGMIQKKDLLKILEETSDNLATMLGDIHQSTSNMEIWETADISTYFFIITTKNETQPDGSVDEVFDTKDQIQHSTSMLEVLATISQMTRHLLQSNISGRPEDPDYIVVKTRMRAYQTMLDVPKNKMQNVIRRLLREEDEEDEFTKNIDLNDHHEMMSFDSLYSNKIDHWEDAGLASAHEENGESIQSNNSKSDKWNSLHTSNSSSNNLSEINLNSLSTRRASMESQRKKKTPLTISTPELQSKTEVLSSPMLSGGGSSTDSKMDK